MNRQATIERLRVDVELAEINERIAAYEKDDSASYWARKAAEARELLTAMGVEVYVEGGV